LLLYFDAIFILHSDDPYQFAGSYVFGNIYFAIDQYFFRQLFECLPFIRFYVCLVFFLEAEYINRSIMPSNYDKCARTTGFSFTPTRHPLLDNPAAEVCVYKTCVRSKRRLQKSFIVNARFSCKARKPFRFVYSD